MGSETEVQAPPAEAPAPEPAAPVAAASGGSKTGMILAIVVVLVLVVAALAYVFVLDTGEDTVLEGQWTVSGGEVMTKLVVNNDTANTTWSNITIPADPEVIDFDNPDTMPEEMAFEDLGDGRFEIVNFDMGDASFGTITGTYNIDGDVMTIEYSGSGSFVDDYSGDFMEAEMDVSMTFARA